MNELAERHVQREQALAHQREDERRGGELRERREVEERLGAAWRVGTGAQIGTERSCGVRLDAAVPLGPHDGRRAELADGRVDDRFRPSNEVGHAKSRMPAPMLNTPGTTAGSEPDGLRSPGRISAAAGRLGARRGSTPRLRRRVVAPRARSSAVLAFAARWGPDWSRRAARTP